MEVTRWQRDNRDNASAAVIRRAWNMLYGQIVLLNVGQPSHHPWGQIGRCLVMKQCHIVRERNDGGPEHMTAPISQCLQQRKELTRIWSGNSVPPH